MVKLTEDMVVARSKGSDLHNIKKLNCWGSELTNVSVVRSLPNVEVLSLSVNQIATLEDFQYCSNLQELYIRKNNISDINEVLYLRQIPKLKSLWLADNPCAEFEEYRFTVLRALPHLQKLDNVPVEPEEIQQAMVCGLHLPLANSNFRGPGASELPRSNSAGESVRSESGGGNSSLSDSSPSSSHPHQANSRQMNGFSPCHEGNYEFSPNVFDEDEEQPPQMRRASMTQQESESYERKATTTYPSQNGCISERGGGAGDKPPHIPVRGILNHKTVANQARNSRFYESSTPYGDYEENDRGCVNNAVQYGTPQRRQMYSGSNRPHPHRQGSPRRSSQLITTPIDSEPAVEPRPFSRSSSDYVYDSHNANYVSRDENYSRYTTDFPAPLSSSQPPCTITNATTTTAIISPTTHQVLENNNNNKNNPFRNSAGLRRTPHDPYREPSWANESDGYHRERNYPRSEDGHRQSVSYAGRPSHEYRSPSGEMRHFPQRPSSVGEVLQQHYDTTYRRVDQQIETAARVGQPIERPSPTRPYPLRPKTRNANVLSAILCLIKELDYSNLEVVEMAIRCRMDELDD